MKIYKKISKILVCGGLIVAFLFTSFAPISNHIVEVKRAEAVFGVGDFVFDSSNTFQNTITAVNSTLSSYSDTSLFLKEYVLDGVVSALAKIIIRQVTTSVVNWINNGFEGSPSFISDPGGFFANIGDEIIGSFIAADGDLAFLCSNFSIDLRIALAFRYSPNVRNRVACTLTGVIENSKGAIENASINGFTRGDFRQGGWPAFIALTQEPQNNIYGAYLEADSFLSARIGDKTASINRDLDRGAGFLSWKNCSNNPEAEEEFYAQSEVDSLEGDSSREEELFYAKRDLAQARDDCPVETPGSVIAGSLEKQLGIPSDELALADEFNEIINALFAQLVTQVLNQGLSTVSGTGPGDLNSYVGQLQGNNAQSNEQLLALRTNLIGSIGPYLNRAKEYQTQSRLAFEAINAVNTTFEQTRKCYQEKLSPEYQPPLSERRKAAANRALESMIKYVSDNISQTLVDATSFANDGNRRVQQLEDIIALANKASIVEDINIATQQFSSLVQAQALTSARDVQMSIERKQEIETVANQHKSEAENRLRLCTIFPQSTEDRDQDDQDI